MNNTFTGNTHQKGLLQGLSIVKGNLAEQQSQISFQNIKSKEISINGQNQDTQNISNQRQDSLEQQKPKHTMHQEMSFYTLHQASKLSSERRQQLLLAGKANQNSNEKKQFKLNFDGLKNQQENKNSNTFININVNSSRHQSNSKTAVNLIEILSKKTPQNQKNFEFKDNFNNNDVLSKRDCLEGGEAEKKQKKKNSVESSKAREEKSQARDDQNSEVFSWGSDRSGQLGLGDINQKQAELGGGLSSFNMPQPRFCVYGISIKMISCGDEHSAFVTTLNHIYTMGSNRCGQLGIRDKDIKSNSSPVLVEQMSGFKIEDISCGGNHSLAAISTGEVYAWGEGRFGALGIHDSESDQYRPQKVLFQQNANSFKVQVIIKQLSAGTKHSAFIDEEGRVFTCGNNENGQLGLATRSVQLLPMQIDNFKHEAIQVKCGIHHTLILTKTGLVYGMGLNSEGQLGIISQHNSSITPLLIEDISHIPMIQIEAGSFSASIAKDTGQVYLWGTGTFGQFKTPHRVKKIVQKAIQISIGDQFGVVLTEDRQIYTWGKNNFGQLGSGDFIDRPTPQLMQKITSEGRMVKQISAGSNSVLCIGTSTCLTVMDEQRIELEKKIQLLEQSQKLDDSTDIRKKRSKKKTSKKDDFRSAINEQISQGSHKSNVKSQFDLQKSHSSILKNKNPKLEISQQFSSQKKTSKDKTDKQKISLKNRSVSNGRYQQKSPVNNNKTKRDNSQKSQSVVGQQKIKYSLKKPKKSIMKDSIVIKNVNLKEKNQKKKKSYDAYSINIVPVTKKSQAKSNTSQQKQKFVLKKNKDKQYSSLNIDKKSEKSSPARLINKIVDKKQLDGKPQIVKNNDEGQKQSTINNSLSRSPDLQHMNTFSNNENVKQNSVQRSIQFQETPDVSPQRQNQVVNSKQLDLNENPFKRSNEMSKEGSKQKSEKYDQNSQQAPSPVRVAISELSAGRDYDQQILQNQRSNNFSDLIQETNMKLNESKIMQNNKNNQNSQSDWGCGITQKDQVRDILLKDQSQSYVSESYQNFEGGDKTGRVENQDKMIRDMKLEMIQYQNEITGLKFKIDNMINERSSMNIEMQHLRDRERNMMDELMFKDQKLGIIESELKCIKVERNHFQDELNRERLKTNDLSCQIQSATFRIQEQQAHLESIDYLNRQIVTLKEDNYRLADIDSQFKVCQQHLATQEENNRRLRDQIFALDQQLGQKIVETQDKDNAIRQIDMDVRDIQAQLEREENQKQLLHIECETLRRELSSLSHAQDMHRQMKIQFENERQMRINQEGDVTRLREQIADQFATSLKDQENLRRALDDMKYQNEECIRQINIKNEEIESLMDQMDNLSLIIERKEHDIADHKANILQLEMKNRKLNETVNKAIHNQTQDNIDKTMTVLKRRGFKEDPEIIRKQREMGINPTSAKRLQNLVGKESLTLQSAVRDLENRQKQQEMLNMDKRNSFNDPARASSDVYDQLQMMKTPGLGYDERLAPENDMTPIQQQLYSGQINHNNWQNIGSRALYPGKEVNLNQMRGLATPARVEKAPDEFDAVQIPQTEEQVIRNRAQTQMTSNMIKNSLAELRGKLDIMKKNKKVVSRGLQDLDDRD